MVCAAPLVTRTQERTVWQVNCRRVFAVHIGADVQNAWLDGEMQFRVYCTPPSPHHTPHWDKMAVSVSREAVSSVNCTQPRTLGVSAVALRALLDSPFAIESTLHVHASMHSEQPIGHMKVIRWHL
jgi:hypothetical protein